MRSFGAVGGPAQHPEDAAQLVHRLAPGGLDVRQRGGGVLRGAVEASPGRRGLDHHHAHRVGDDVVEFAGDPSPFVGDSPLCDEFTLALGALEPFLEHVGGLASSPEVVADHEGGDEHDDTRDEARHVEFVDHEPRDEQHADRQDGRDQQPGSTRPDRVRAERVERDQDPDEPRPVDVGELGHHLRGDDDRGGHERVRAPPGDREHRCDDERHRPPCGRRVLGGLSDLGEVHRHRRDRQHGCEDQIGGLRVRANPADRCGPPPADIGRIRHDQDDGTER